MAKDHLLVAVVRKPHDELERKAGSVSGRDPPTAKGAGVNLSPTGARAAVAASDEETAWARKAAEAALRWDRSGKR